MPRTAHPAERNLARPVPIPDQPRQIAERAIAPAMNALLLSGTERNAERARWAAATALSGALPQLQRELLAAVPELAGLPNVAACIEGVLRTLEGIAAQGKQRAFGRPNLWDIAVPAASPGDAWSPPADDWSGWRWANVTIGYEEEQPTRLLIDRERQPAFGDEVAAYFEGEWSFVRYELLPQRSLGWGIITIGGVVVERTSITSAGRKP